ncbi:MAG: 4-hydroxy-3-methylbut-2-enyl diphosphate reductase [Bacilli bacterium]|nr:4-hydroxy-3-methylbut-2-enyl diphosphate reductase [Bacilli bacterium]
MKVDIISPYGYCAGVISALMKAKKAKDEHKDENIYLLGMLVHNEETVRELSSLGLKVIDEKKEDLLLALNRIEEGSVVIFSAHGHPKEYEEVAKRRNLKIIDATCIFVSQNEDAAKQDIEKGESVVYLGSKGHLETIGFLSNVKEASFYDVKSKQIEEDKLPSSCLNPIVYSQTTLSLEEVNEAITKLKERYPLLRLGRLRCHSTSLRQQRLLSLPSDVDCVIVLGSKTSNNSVKLYELAKSIGKNAYLCLNENEVRKIDLSHFHHLALATGASTSKENFSAVKAYLESL